jgi:UDP-N-acetylmuramate-alanine ligase
MAAEPVPAARLGRVHFAGIGGAGMSGIARIMLARGIGVSGSDARDSALLGELRELGASVHVGHAPEPRPPRPRRHAGGVERHPAGQPGTDRGGQARDAGRAPGGGARLGDGRPPGDRGRRDARQDHHHLHAHHGAARVRGRPRLRHRRDPHRDRARRGGRIRPGLRGRGGRERRVFLLLSPDLAIITNVEADHLDNYASLADIQAAFTTFGLRVSGIVLTCADDPGAEAVAARLDPARVRRYGESRHADYRLTDVASRGDGDQLHRGGRPRTVR